MKPDDDLGLANPFVRDKGEGRGVRVAAVKCSDLSHPVAGHEERVAGTKDVPSVMGRKTKLAVLGIPSYILDEGHPEYARCIRLANAYKKARTKELYEAHGYVSSGASALLAAASLALSASRYLFEVAAGANLHTTERGEVGLPQLLKLATSLSDSHRQNELSCFELCHKESVLRKRNDSNKLQSPWLLEPSSTKSSSVEKRGPGRPRKIVQNQEENS